MAAAAASSSSSFFASCFAIWVFSGLSIIYWGKKIMPSLLFCSASRCIFRRRYIWKPRARLYISFWHRASQPSPSHPFTPSFLLSQSGVYMIWRCASVSVRIQLVSFHFFLWGVVIWGVNPKPEVLPGTPSLSWALASSFVLFALPVIWNVWWPFRLLFPSPGTSSHL